MLGCERGGCARVWKGGCARWGGGEGLCCEYVHVTCVSEQESLRLGLAPLGPRMGAGGVARLSMPAAHHQDSVGLMSGDWHTNRTCRCIPCLCGSLSGICLYMSLGALFARICCLGGEVALLFGRAK